MLVVGSSNTDMIIKFARIPRPGETLLGDKFSIAPGGKGANQAVAAARAGGDATFVACVGRDMFGNQAEATKRLRNLRRAIHAVDTITVQLVVNCINWAKRRTRKAAAKNPHAHLPAKFPARLRDCRQRGPRAPAVDPHRREPTVYHDFEYKTLDGWSRKRRVIGKVERLGDKAPRFIVTTLGRPRGRTLRKIYCARAR